VAKTSKIAKNEQRKRTVALYADRRTELKRIIADPASAFDERGAAQLKLQKLPRDASPIRVPQPRRGRRPAARLPP
jgi:small subunit ribosomal protein S14